MSVGDSGFGEVEAGLLGSVAVLRWARPDLLADVAEHVAETDAGDDRTWIQAVGWMVHGRAAVGDGRPCAAAVLDDLGSRAPGLLDDPAAHRLRVEIALLAAAAGEAGIARDLVAPVLAASASAETRADAFGVIVRCAVEERPGAVGDPARRAEVAWAEVGGTQAEIGAAAVALVAASANRRSSRPDAAAERAAEGLTRLDQVRGSRTATPSRHLAAALAAEWIGALLDAGRPDDAREGSVPLEARLRESARPSRQVALLRLTVVRAMVGSAPLADVADALEQAVRDVAIIDVPELEALCLSTLGAVHEQAGRAAAAGDARRRAADAQRLDAARRDRFLEALRAVSGASSTVVTPSALWVPTGGSSPIGDLVARALAEAPAASRQVDPPPPARPPAAVTPPPKEDPWSSGRWVATPPGGTGGRRTRPAAPVPPVDPLDTADDGWLQAAMAELDRVWGTSLMRSTPEPVASAAPPPVDGCTVVVDVVRAGDPVTGAGAAAAVRQVAEHVAESLPGGARLRRDDHAVTVVLPGWGRAEAGDWMHRTLPARFAAVVSEVHATGTALRATVHDIDGPVGAQLLQRLDVAPARRAGGGRHDGPAAGGAAASGRRHRAEPAGDQWAARNGAGATGTAGRPDGPASSPANNGHATPTGEPTHHAGTRASRDVDALLRELRVGSGRARDAQASGAHRAHPVAGAPWSAYGSDGARLADETPRHDDRSSSAGGGTPQRPDRSAPRGDGSRAERPRSEPSGFGSRRPAAGDGIEPPRLGSPSDGAGRQPVAADGFGPPGPGSPSGSATGRTEPSADGVGDQRSERTVDGDQRSDPRGDGSRGGRPGASTEGVRERAAVETDGLGLADLLAGALAAYRSI